jgi:hypothetical protein
MTREMTNKFQEQVPLSYEEHFRRIFTIFVSFLRTLEKEIGYERMIDIVRIWNNQRGVEIGERGSFENFEDFRDYWMSTAENKYWSCTFTVEFPEITESVLQCKYTECLWAKIFNELNATDIGKAAICEKDFAMAKAISPHLRLERTKTLMEGHDCCNHRFIWE